MKYAILFTFAVFAVLAQTDANVVLFEPLKNVDRGAVAQFLQEKLAAAKDKLEEMLNKAQYTLKEKINEAKNKAEHLIEQLKQTADKINDNVFEAVNKILDKVSNLEDELVEQAKKAFNKHDSNNYKAEYEQNEII